MKNIGITLLVLVITHGYVPIAEAQTIRSLRNLTRDAKALVETINNTQELMAYYDTVGHNAPRGYDASVDPLLDDEELDMPVSKLKASESAGTVHPDATVLDVDYCGSFAYGAAVVMKGDQFALINHKGEFLVPFGEYEFAPNEYLRLDGKNVRPSSPFFLASKDGKNYMLSPEGKVRYETSEKLERVGHDFLFAREARPKKREYTYIGHSGQVYTSPHNIGSIGSGIYIDRSNRRQPVFRTMDGKELTEETFDFLGDFHDEMAVVGKTSDGGEMRYGYIDKEGVLVIPFKYTKLPGPFINGYAKVLGADGTEMEHAFINKQGDVAFEKKLTDRLRSEFHFHWNGYFVGNWDVADLEGNVKSIKRVAVNDLGLDLNHYNLGAFWSRAVFVGDHRFRISDGINKWGYIDLKNDIVVDAIFEDDFIPFNFDSVSKLAYAEMVLPIADKSDTQTTRKGYINGEGVFVLVFHEERSTW